MPRGRRTRRRPGRRPSRPRRRGRGLRGVPTPRIRAAPPTPQPMGTWGPSQIPPPQAPIQQPYGPYVGTGPTGPSGMLQQPAVLPIQAAPGPPAYGSTAWMTDVPGLDPFGQAFQRAQQWEYTGPRLLDIQKAFALKKAKAFEYHGPRWPEEFGPEWQDLAGPWYQEMQQQPTRAGGGGGYYSPRYTYGGGGGGRWPTVAQPRARGPGIGRLYAQRAPRGRANAQGLITWRI